jgi:diguanylate cyclase (GGDEF)-like protein
MSVQALGAWTSDGRSGTQPLGLPNREVQVSRLRRRLAWAAAAGGAFATLAAVAGTLLGNRPTVVGALALAAAVAMVPLLLRGLATRVVAHFEVSIAARETLEAELDAARKAMEEFRGLAYHDALTGLPNRSLFHDRLSVAITHARREGSHLAVLFLDLDGFKAVNDALGHACGDRLLVEVAERLRGSVRAGDTVARFGGDEFVVLLSSVAGEDDAERVAAKLLEAVRGPFRIDGHVLAATASIGVSVYPGDGTSPEELVVSADVAMYRHKHAQGSRGDRVEGAA